MAKRTLQKIYADAFASVVKAEKPFLKNARIHFLTPMGMISGFPASHDDLNPQSVFTTSIVESAEKIINHTDCADEITGDGIVLKDVKIYNGNIHLDCMILFTDQILGIAISGDTNVES